MDMYYGILIGVIVTLVVVLSPKILRLSYRWVRDARSIEIRLEDKTYRSQKAKEGHVGRIFKPKVIKLQRGETLSDKPHKFIDTIRREKDGSIYILFNVKTLADS